MGARADDGGELELTEVYEMNVTPFIGVILVLLMIFMIAAPLATIDVGVEILAANAQRGRGPNNRPF